LMMRSIDLRMLLLGKYFLPSFGDSMREKDLRVLAP